MNDSLPPPFLIYVYTKKRVRERRISLLDFSLLLAIVLPGRSELAPVKSRHDNVSICGSA
jgi:hypothetical protein